METRQPAGGLTRLLRFAALTWLVYLVLLLVVDRLFGPRHPFMPVYYVVNGLNALIVLILATCTWIQERLQWVFWLLIIVLMSAMPLFLDFFLMPWIPPGPISDEAGMALRSMPVLFLALVLTAWVSSWDYTVLFCLATAGLSLGLLLWFRRPFEPAFFAGLMVLVVRTISFLMVGYFLSTLIDRMRKQQASLEAFNVQLVHHASTLEHLTISQERNRMARELHDTLAHTLSGLAVQLETVKAFWNVDPTTAQGMLDRSLDAARSGLQETRRALKSLRASPLDDLGLKLGIQRLAESAAQRAGLLLDLSLPETTPSLPPDVEQCLYRVAQEAIANVVYHANAQHLKVQLVYHRDHVSLLVQDDGQGFDARQHQRSGHFGLSGMRERAQLAGGQLTINSRPGLGTSVHLSI